MLQLGLKVVIECLNNVWYKSIINLLLDYYFSAYKLIIDKIPLYIYNLI